MSYSDNGNQKWEALHDQIAMVKAEMARIEATANAMRQAYFFDRYHAFDGIKDDRCPACGGRVGVDDSDPSRTRIRSIPTVTAS